MFDNTTDTGFSSYPQLLLVNYNVILFLKQEKEKTNVELSYTFNTVTYYKLSPEKSSVLTLALNELSLLLKPILIPNALQVCLSVPHCSLTHLLISEQTDEINKQ